MTEIEYRIADLINFSSNQKPIEFEGAFKSILQDKVSAAIDNRKIELAQTMFNPPSDEQEVEATDDEIENEEDLESEEAEEELDA